MYDLPIIGLTIAWYGWHGFQQGWLPSEKIVLAIAWIMPLFSEQIARFTNIQVVPVVLLAIVILAVRRINVEKESEMNSNGSQFYNNSN